MAEALVLDASVAVKGHLPDEDHVAIANYILAQFAAGELGLVAPAIFRSELASAITVATIGRNPRLSVVDSQAAIANSLGIDIKTHPDAALIPAAYSLLHQYRCALYDALYLALSEQVGLPFITADRKLYQRVSHLPTSSSSRTTPCPQSERLPLPSISSRPAAPRPRPATSTSIASPSSLPPPI